MDFDSGIKCPKCMAMTKFAVKGAFCITPGCNWKEGDETMARESWEVPVIGHGNDDYGRASRQRSRELIEAARRLADAFNVEQRIAELEAELAKLKSTGLLPITGSECRTTHHACACVLEQLGQLKAENERLREKNAKMREALEEIKREGVYYSGIVPRTEYEEGVYCAWDDASDIAQAALRGEEE